MGAGFPAGFFAVVFFALAAFFGACSGSTTELPLLIGILTGAWGTATCLQSPAQSGQEHCNSISAGCGKSPLLRSVRRRITPSSNRPCNRSINERIDCEQSRLMRFHSALPSVSIETLTL